MDNNRKLDMLRNLINDQDEDMGLLSVYLELAENAILSRLYPYKNDYTGLKMPDRYVMLQLSIAAYLMNKRGAEGQTKHSENGIVREFASADIPNDMLSSVVPYVGVIGE